MTEIDSGSSWHGYPKVWTLGHSSIDGIMDGEVCVEEKVDGSQTSFGIFGGRIRFKSKNQELDVAATGHGMFEQGVAAVLDMAERGALVDGWTYRAEYLRAPRHNTLAYERAPRGHFVLFDVSIGHHKYLDPADRAEHAERLGIDAVPIIERGRVTPDDVREFLNQDSFLGGAKVEGVVLKDHGRFDPRTGWPLFGKYVSEAFKEKNKAGHAQGKRSDAIALIAETYRSEARWTKAVQSMRDDGVLSNDPRDIGELMKRVQCDLEAEEREAIAAALYREFRKPIIRRSIAGLAEWYKDRLMVGSFR